MNCPVCQNPGAYIGFVDAECPNPKCTCYKPDQCHSFVQEFLSRVDDTTFDIPIEGVQEFFRSWLKKNVPWVHGTITVDPPSAMTTHEGEEVAKRLLHVQYKWKNNTDGPFSEFPNVGNFEFTAYERVPAADEVEDEEEHALEQEYKGPGWGWGWALPQWVGVGDDD